MITLDDARRLTGTTAYGPDGDKVGKVGQVYLDNDSGQPEWVTVHTGLFGTNESLVPLEGADVEGDTLRLAYDKSRIKDAPNIATDHELSPDDETELYRYYGVMTGRDDDGRLYDDNDDGYDTSHATTDDAMTRSREEIRTGTERVEAGRARLRKYVVTDHEQVDVPVTREEVRVEREPITDANAGAAMDGPALSEAEHEVVLTQDRPVVTTEAVPVERVRLSKEEVAGTESVGVDRREERIETDVDEDRFTDPGDQSRRG